MGLRFICQRCGKNHLEEAMGDSPMTIVMMPTTAAGWEPDICPTCGGLVFAVNDGYKLAKEFTVSILSILLTIMTGLLAWAIMFWLAGLVTVADPKPGTLFWPAAHPMAGELNGFLIRLAIYGGITGILFAIIATVNASRWARLDRPYPDHMAVPYNEARAWSEVWFLGLIIGVILGIWVVPSLAPEAAGLRSTFLRTIGIAVLCLISTGITYGFLNLFHRGKETAWEMD